MSATEQKAVFLSYASQDAEAARRLAEALRATGIEVWFDIEGGLETGDEWDAKIRRQIKECVLFLPLISANTQARLEGYFRIEWELASERAMGIAAGVAFIIPVVIDDTREVDALVPDRFRKVQWTRLPGGAVTPEVQQRLAKLWSHRLGVVAHEAARAGGGTRPGFATGRSLAAIVFTDVVGYSARMQRDEKGTLALVEEDFRFMRERCAAHDGEVLNSMGDGLLMCFPSAVQAVACALELQTEFGRRRAVAADAAALEHRMGVHIGDVIRTDGGVAGDGVNIAARLEGKAPPGGVCISQIVHDTVSGKVPMQAVFIGPESFKNIGAPIPVWHIAPEGSPSLSRPPMAPRPGGRVGRRRRAWWALAAVVALAALGGGGFGIYQWHYRKQELAVLEALNLAPEPPIKRDGRVLVAPLENRTGDPALDDLGQQVADHVRRRLPALEWVAQARAVRATDRLTAEASATEMRALAKQADADTLIAGYYRRAGDRLEFHGQAFDLKREVIFAELAPVEGAVTAPGAAIEETAERLLGVMVPLPRVRQGRPHPERFVDLAVPRRFDSTQVSEQGRADDLGRYRRAYERDPKGALGALVALALAHVTREQYAEADAVLREVEAAGPGRMPEYPREVARWLRATLDGDSAGLAVTVDRLCQIAPWMRMWRSERGYGHYRANRPLALLAEFKAISPGSPGERVSTVWRARVIAHFLLDDLANMEAAARRLLATEDDSETAHWALSYVALRRGDFAAAMRVLDDYDGLRARGDLAFNLYVASLAAMRAEGRAGSPEFAVLLRRAEAWLASRPTAEAGTIETRFTRGELAYVAGRYTEALSLAQEMLRERPDDVRVQGFLGTSAARLGDTRLAEETIARLRARDPRFQFGYPRFAEAKIAAVLGRHDEAMQLLREAFAQYTIMIKDFSWEGVRLSPDFESLRGDPRFQEFIKPRG